MTTKSYEKVCAGCGEAKCLGGYQVCMSCTHARAAAVKAGKCRCGPLKKPQEKHGAGRTWTACGRCLGVIPQGGHPLADELMGAL